MDKTGSSHTYWRMEEWAQPEWWTHGGWCPLYNADFVLIRFDDFHKAQTAYDRLRATGRRVRIVEVIEVVVASSDEEDPTVKEAS